MANGRPGDSVHHDIVHHRIPCFGRDCDDLVREITDRLPPERQGPFVRLVESWPYGIDGKPLQPHDLRQRLEAWRASIDDPSLEPNETVPPQHMLEPEPVRAAGRVLRGIIGCLAGAALFAFITLITGSFLIEGNAPGDRALGDGLTLLAIILVASIIGGVLGARWMLRR